MNKLQQMFDEMMFGKDGKKVNGYKLTDTGCWILDVGYRMMDTGCWILDAGCWKNA